MSKPFTDLLHHLRRLAAPPRDDSDAELLDHFARRGDEDAFAILMARYGPMVLNTCRRVLGDAHAAEDAFQAVFLVLARRAGSLRRPQALAGWLHGVACRAAREVRRRLARQPSLRLGETSELIDTHRDPLAALTARDLLSVLEEEVQRLPRDYRLAVVLCCLEGLSQEEAARRLGWTAGAVKGRLERGRKRLRQKLEKRGVALSAVLGAVEVTRGTVTASTAALLPRVALAFASGQATAGAEMVTLAERVIRVMMITRVKVACALVLTAAVLTAGVGVAGHRVLAARQPEETPKTDASQPETGPPPRAARKAAPLPVVSGFFATPIRFTGAANLKVAGAVLDLLASCHHAHAPDEGPMPEWDDVLLDCVNKKIYLHVQLPKARIVETAMGKDDKVQVSEVILELRPGGLWVRSGNKAKWYAKYEHDKMVRLQGLLKFADADNPRMGKKDNQAEKQPLDPVTVSGLLGGRNRTFAHGLSTEVEGLVIALLGSCNVGRAATKKEWEAALQEEHLRVKYPKPRVLTATVQEGHTFEVNEIVMEGVISPKFFFVRFGNTFRAFTKYDPHIWFLLKDRYLARLVGK